MRDIALERSAQCLALLVPVAQTDDHPAILAFPDTRLRLDDRIMEAPAFDNDAIMLKPVVDEFGLDRLRAAQRQAGIEVVGPDMVGVSGDEECCACSRRASRAASRMVSRASRDNSDLLKPKSR